MQDIRFLKVKEPNGYLSNFFPRNVRYGGLVWKCNERLYQAQKHKGTQYYHGIHQAETSWKAMKLGRAIPTSVQNWDFVKDDTMRTCAFLKFIQNRDLRQELLSTGDARIVEAGGHDSYWAEGPDGKGLNRLGVIHMEIRAVLRNSSSVSDYVTALAQSCGMIDLQPSDLTEIPNVPQGSLFKTR
jgi:ribA/ribD-fused uncharacterized protein